MMTASHRKIHPEIAVMSKEPEISVDRISRRGKSPVLSRVDTRNQLEAFGILEKNR
jgi:hypothetical protein